MPPPLQRTFEEKSPRGKTFFKEIVDIAVTGDLLSPLFSSAGVGMKMDIFSCLLTGALVKNSLGFKTHSFVLEVTIANGIGDGGRASNAWRDGEKTTVQGLPSLGSPQGGGGSPWWM